MSCRFRPVFLLLILPVSAGLSFGQRELLSSSPPNWPRPIYKLEAEVKGESDTTGGSSSLHTAAAVESGEMLFDFSLGYGKSLALSRLALRHPEVRLGFLKYGALLSLVSSPGGSWDKAPRAALSEGVTADEDAVIPDSCGMVLKPLSGGISLFSFLGPKIDLAGIHVLAESGHLLSELLATASRSERAPPGDEWLDERSRVTPGPIYHCLARSSVELSPLRLSAGSVVSFSRYALPQIAASLDVEIGVPAFVLTATISGGTRDYVGLDGKPAAPPFTWSWGLATGKKAPVRLYLIHAVEIESLPLLGIPFRETDETLKAGCNAGFGSFSIDGRARIRIQTTRTGWQEISWGAGLSTAADLDKLRFGLSGDISRAYDKPIAWRVSVPLDIAAPDIRVETAFTGGEFLRFEASVALRGGEGPRLRWYVSAGGAMGWSPVSSFEFRYRMGWKTTG